MRFDKHVGCKAKQDGVIGTVCGYTQDQLVIRVDDNSEVRGWEEVEEQISFFPHNVPTLGYYFVLPENILE